jgi:hypothetical protein
LIATLETQTHPDLDAQIDRITTNIAAQKDASELLWQRAESYRRHAQFDEALRDVTEAAALTLRITEREAI